MIDSNLNGPSPEDFFVSQTSNKVYQAPLSKLDFKFSMNSLIHTVPNHIDHIQNKHIFLNKHTIFSLTKMCLFCEAEDFGRINSLYFFNIESLKTHFLLLLENCVMQNFLFFKFEKQESFSPILRTKNPLGMLEIFLSQKNI